MNKHEILIETKKRLYLHTHGEHDTIFGGSGLDFKEIREYNSNDDIRHINWKVTSQNQKAYVNTFHQSKQISVVLVYLNSASLYFGEPKSKQKLCVEILTSLGYATILGDDRLSTIFCTKNGIEYFSQTTNRQTVDQNYDLASSLPSLGNGLDYPQIVDELLYRIKQKSVIFLIGDFLEELDLQHLSTKHELHCIIVRDKREENLELLGEYNIIDPITQQTHTIDIDTNSIK